MQKGSATGRLLVSCHHVMHARAPDYGETTLGTICTDAPRQHEKESLTNFPARGRSISRFTQIREGKGLAAVALHVTRRPMIAIVVNLAIYRICQHSKPRPGMKERNGRAGKEGKRQAPFARVRARLRCRRRRGRGDLRRAIAYAHTYAYVGRTGNGVIWPK